MNGNHKFVVSVNGKSGSGKTSLLKKMIPALIKKGYKVGAIKHTHHDFEIDKRGKDSWAFRRAGAASVVISSNNRMAFIRELDNEIPAREIIRQLFDDEDIVLIEGYKKEGFPRIEVIGKKIREMANTVFFDPSVTMMIVSEEPLDTHIPVYSPKKPGQIADALEERMKIFYKNPG